MNLDNYNLTSALLLGLMGAGHCLGMCGGIIGSLSFATANTAHKWINISLYQVGRILTYIIFGFTVGIIGQQSQSASEFPFLQLVSGTLLILMGLYISRIWMGLSYLEKLGKHFWDKISPISKKLMPINSPYQALLLGGLWGWLPCGLVYSALGYALSLATPIQSASFMAAFGLGTLPATLLAGVASLRLKAFLSHFVTRALIALFFISYGVVIFYQIFFAASTHHHMH